MTSDYRQMLVKQTPQSSRGKYYQQKDNIKEGALVLIKSENNGPGQWSLARVTRLHPGSDSLVRAVTVKTATSQLQRSIVKLIPLPINGND